MYFTFRHQTKPITVSVNLPSIHHLLTYYLVIHVRRSNLRPEFHGVAILAIQTVVGSVIVCQTVQKSLTIDASKAISVVP